MKKVLCLIGLLIFTTANSFAATTLTHSSGSEVYQLNTLDTDYTFTYHTWVDSIEFDPGAANEYIVLKVGSDSGERILKLLSSDGEPRIKYFDASRIQIMYDASESSVTSSAKIIIVQGQ